MTTPPPIKPRPPVTTLTDADLPVNLYTGQGHTLYDYVIDGSGDSAVLLQPGTTGNDLRRFKVTRVGELNTVPYDKHGVYLKSRGNTLRDFDLSGSAYASDGISVRMGGNLIRRARIRLGFVFAIAYYEHDDEPGVVRFENITGVSSHPDTCIWGDDSNGCTKPHIKQAFAFKDVHLSGGKLFLSFGASCFAGQGRSFAGSYVWIAGCTINGRPVTAADVKGVPAAKLQISATA